MQKMQKILSKKIFFVVERHFTYRIWNNMAKHYQFRRYDIGGLYFDAELEGLHFLGIAVIPRRLYCKYVRMYCTYIYYMGTNNFDDLNSPGQDGYLHATGNSIHSEQCVLRF